MQVKWPVILMDLLGLDDNPDAKHVFSFTTLRKYRDPSNPSRSPIILPVPQSIHLLHNLHSLQKVIHLRNRVTARRPIPRTPLWLETDDKNAPKPVAGHFLSNHSKQHMPVCGLFLHQGSTESRETLQQKFIFQTRTLSPQGINERELIYSVDFHATMLQMLQQIA